MKTLSIYETKAKLSQVLKMVKNGQEIIITERGNPIAKLIPISSDDSLTERLEQLRKQGLLDQRKKSDFGSLPIKKTGVIERFLQERE